MVEKKLVKYHFFVIPAVDCFEAQQELNSFCSQHRAVTVEKHFVEAGANSFWSICVETTEGEKLLASSKRKSQVDYKEILSARRKSMNDQIDIRFFRGFRHGEQKLTSPVC